MELDPLHCLLGNTTNTANSNLRAQKEHCSSVRSQKSPSFPILGLSRQHLFKSPAVPPSFHYVAQDICKVSAKTLPLIHKGSIWGLSLLKYLKFLKYQVILNHTVLPQENCFTYIKYIRLSKSTLLQDLFISKCHLLLGAFFHEINDVWQRSYVLLYWYFSMTPNFEKETDAETICFAAEMV